MTSDQPAKPQSSADDARGGKRPGAGRKRLPPEEVLQTYTLRIEADLIAWLEKNGGRKFAARLLRQAETQSRII